MPDLQHRLREGLSTAMRERDRAAARVLRTVLAAIANAEAQPHLDETPVSLRSEGAIAGAVDGVAAADVVRRALTDAQVRVLVVAERDERLSAADDLAGRGAVEAATALRDEAALLERYLA